MLNPINGERLRFSLLKFLALSPKHFRHACLTPREATRGMRIGTGAHVQLLGQRPGHRVVCFDGEARRGKAWDAFDANHKLIAEAEGVQIDILTAPEWDEAAAISAAVRADTQAAILFEEGMRHEVPLEWEGGGFECATGGLDAVGRKKLIDLKITNSVEPERCGKLAFNMLYPQQLAFYAEGCAANGIDISEGVFLVNVEARAPYDVTVFELTPETLDLGRKSLSLWRETLRNCALSDHWPGYTQSVIKLEPPLWMVGEEPEPGDEEEGEAA